VFKLCLKTCDPPDDGQGMSIAVAGRPYGVNRSITHFVKTHEDRSGEALRHWPIYCVCLRESFLENTERTS
jgi:hypothetical protein